MADLFEDECLERMAQRGANVGLLAAWCWALADLARGALTERGGAVVRSYGLVKWGGAAAVVGGSLIAAEGLAYSTAGGGGYNSPTGLAFLLSLVHGLGTLLVFGGLLGLVCLIERQGAPATPTTAVAGRGGPRRLSWAQRSAKWGLVLATASALAAATELAWTVTSAGILGGYATGVWGAVANASALVLGIFRTLGLPAAVALLGIAAWRSGTLGRWGVLPLAVALLASPLPTIVIAIFVFPSMSVPASSVTTLDHLLVSGLPAALSGAGWVLLGTILARNVAEGRAIRNAT